MLRLNSSFPLPYLLSSLHVTLFLPLPLCLSLSFSSRAREDIPKRMMAHELHICAGGSYLRGGIAKESRDERGRGACKYSEYLALSIQRKGITYYRRLPLRHTFIYCYPVSRGEKHRLFPSQLMFPSFLKLVQFLLSLSIDICVRFLRDRRPMLHTERRREIMWDAFCCASVDLETLYF